MTIVAYFQTSRCLREAESLIKVEILRIHTYFARNSLNPATTHKSTAELYAFWL